MAYYIFLILQHFTTRDTSEESMKKRGTQEKTTKCQLGRRESISERSWSVPLCEQDHWATKCSGRYLRSEEPSVVRFVRDFPCQDHTKAKGLGAGYKDQGKAIKTTGKQGKFVLSESSRFL